MSLPTGWDRLRELQADDWAAIGFIVFLGLGFFLSYLGMAGLSLAMWRDLLRP